MTRPGVSVVMPFAGSPADAAAALAALRALDARPGDELILADNVDTVPSGDDDGVRVVRVAGERSPSHARNAGAECAGCDWILFLDADCRAPADLLDRFFAEPVAAEVGALAGAVVAASGASGLAERYGAARSFLDQDAHLAHPYLPRAVAANLLVRREAFDAIGGFYEGVRAAEDTDFSWRLQRAGWTLAGRPGAAVEHRYRTTVRALRRQWRGYAAGRAWLARRYRDFEPEPALTRAARRALHPRGAGGADTPDAAADPRPSSAPSRVTPPGRRHQGAFLALDALLGVEELAGFVLSNRPRGGRSSPGGPTRVVLVADRFPARDDPLTDFALSLAGARVEAAARPEASAPQVARRLAIHYREDDGMLARVAGLARVVVRHPLRCADDRLRRGPDAPRLAAIAPAVTRLERDHGARVHALGGGDSRAVAHRLARLAGRTLGT
jgi:GT2 family glycosyltransferase